MSASPVSSFSPVGALLDVLAFAPSGRSRPPRSPLEWRLLIRAAERTELEPMLYHALTASGAKQERSVPEEARAHLQALYGRSALRNGLILNALQEALRALDDAGVDVVVLKGAYLAGAVYDSPALRPMNDVDIMVRRSSVDRAVRTLRDTGWAEREEAGGTRKHHVPAFDGPGGTLLELHWTLELPSAPFVLDIEGVWDRSVATSLAGAPARCLAVEDLLLHLSLHAGYHHRWGETVLTELPLRWVFDVALVLDRLGPTIDWPRLSHRARAWRASSFLYCAISLAAALFSVSTAEGALDGIDHTPEDERIVAVLERLLGTDTRATAPHALRAWRRSDSAGEGARAILRSIFPRPGRIAQMYGLPPGSRRVWLLYPARVVDLIVRRGAKAFGLIVRTPRGRELLERESAKRMVAQWVDSATPRD